MDRFVLGSGAAAMQLSFQIVNNAGDTPAQNVIYITSDATYNQVSLQIELTSGSTTLSPGTIPDPSSPPSTGTTIYLDLSGLQLTPAAWKQLSPSATGWTFKTFPEEGVIGMTPASSIPFTSGTSGVITIGIAGIVVPQALATPLVQLYADYYGVPGVQGMYSAFAVAIQNRPGSGEDLSQAIAVSLGANGIVNSPSSTLTARNAFGLQFSSTQRVQVKAGPDTVFTVGFVYGKPHDPYGFGALTDVESANLIAAAAGLNAAQWTITRNSSAQSPSWTLQPPNGAPLVGSGAQSIVEIDFSNVVTTFQPGPTLMLISYANVPGYQDGIFALVLNKVAHASIGSLQVTPNPACFSGGSASVTVSWAASGAQGLDLTQNFLTTSVTGKTSLPATLNSESTVFSLKATGAPGTVENVDYRTVTAIALPVINSFTGSPTEIYAGSVSHDAMFAWAVDSSDGVTLSSTGGAFSGQAFSATGNTTVSIAQPQLVTLAPTTALNPLTLTRRLLISAFTPTPKTYAVSFTPTTVGISPTGPFVLAGGSAQSGLLVADTVQYTSMGNVATGRNATAIAFSDDGGTVATANADKTVSVFSVSTGPNGLPIFGSPATVTLGGVPQAVVFSENGPRIFVSVSGTSASQAGQVVSLLQSGGIYQVEATVTVGRQPAGLTLDAAGSRLFVANAGDDTVSVVGLTQGGALGGVTTIHQVAGGPAGIAATPSGQQLLVSCAKAGTVVVLDPNHPDTGQRKTLTVGKAPGQMAVLPNGAYAFVVNTADGTVSLIDCWGLPSNASVLGSPVQVGSGAAGIAVSADGLQVLVATGGGLSVVTLATYQATSTAPSVANRPTSVECYVDGSAVFAWHDASLPATAKSPGILVYDLTSAMLSNVLADKAVMRCVASPDPLSKLAFAIVQADPTLYLIDTESLDVSPLSLRLAAGAAPVALAVSGNGNMAYVVAADASRALSLVVLQPAASGSGWVQGATLPLYQATTAGRILLRSTPDGSTLFLVDVAAAQVRVLRKSATGYVLSSTVIHGDVSAIDLAVLPDGSAAYVLNAGTNTNTITVVDVATLNSRVVAIPQTYVNLTGLQPSPDGRRLFATDTNAAALRVLDPASLRILQTIALSATSGGAAGASGLAVMPDGSKIFTANTTSQTLSIVEQIQMGTGAAHTVNADAGEAMRQLLRRVAGPRALSVSAVGDTSSALFMRHAIGDSPTTPTSGWSSSPDVIPYGLNIAPDPTIFTTPAGYNTDYGATVYMKNPNYVYVRGLNTTAAQITSRAYFYYTRGSLALWPANWSSENVTVNNTVQNWVDVTAPPVSATSNGVGLGTSPLLWTPPQLDPGSDHYCVIAWVDNSPNPQPPDFSKYSKFATFDDLVQFVMSHHNMAWRNTVDVVTPPPDFSYNTALSMMSGGGSVILSITFPNVPLDGSIAVNVQGTDPSNSVALPQSSLSNYQGGYSPRNNPLVFPANFKTSVQVQHWPGATPLPPNAQIKVSLAVQTAPSLMNDIQRMYQPMGLRTPLRRWGGFPVFIIGSTTYNLKFGNAGANGKLQGVAR